MSGLPSPTELAREYGAARRRMTDLVVGADEVVAAQRVPACPDWTVHALCSHVTGIAADLVARRNPGGDTQTWVDNQIRERAHRPLGEVLGEWEEVGPRFEELIERKPAGFSGLLYDLVAHEHDLRSAIGAPGARDTLGLLAAMEIERGLLERDLAAQGLPAVLLVAGSQQFRAGDGEPGLSLDVGDRTDGVFELFRLLGSRRSRRQLEAYAWNGDLERFLPALAHMPLPEDDLSE
ncbi:MAG: hypothetical protein JWM12_1820 [Ilumatobacteraceae bacterium]|jgi:uncharacterized protein (TIGR03083 family)|nr:hypothetical protein [Ilumatobacteraceae bacterium]